MGQVETFAKLHGYSCVYFVGTKNQYYANKALLYHLRECDLIDKIQMCDKMKHNTLNVIEE